jgi:hypothetical protein
MKQLYRFVQRIEAMYRENAFQNFEHASHVLISVSMLLNQIIVPDISAAQQSQSDLPSIDRLSSTNNSTIKLSRKRVSGVNGLNTAALHDHTKGMGKISDSIKSYDANHGFVQAMLRTSCALGSIIIIN